MKMKRLYINLTNKCNRKCPFCFMWSGPNNNIFMDQNTYKNIITGYNIDNEQFDIQLGGGEPLLHPQFFDYVDFACTQPLIKTVIIDTNGVILDDYIKTLFRLSQKYHKTIILKISVNYSLIEQDPSYLQKLQKWSKNYPNSDFWILCLSIRHRTPQSLDEPWLDELINNNYYGYAHNFHPIEFTGRAKQNKVKGTVLSGDIDPKGCISCVYACDGTYFATDFDARMDYEKTLSNEQ